MSLTAVMLLAGLMFVIGTAHLHQAQLAAGPRFYFDCSRRSEGDGTMARPWNALADAGRLVLTPGRSLLLRRGTVCHGALAPRGSGSARAPVVIGAYGNLALRDPRIETAGGSSDSVSLADEAHIVLEDLELSNHGDRTHSLRGVHVIGSRSGTVKDITIRRLFVHDVGGADNKGLGGSGGIQIDEPTANVTIESNLIEHVNRSGIWITGSGQAPRPTATQAWPSATTGVVVRRNTLRWVGGDGIVSLGTVGASLTDNVVCCANLRGRAGRQYDAGIWTFDANRTAIERNLVYSMANGTADGTGYDIDYEQDGTVVRSNIGYGNAGGFILLCAAIEPHRTAEVSFNLSVQEYALREAPCDGFRKGSHTLSGIKIYNNTFVTQTSRILGGNRAVSTLQHAGTAEFFNNVVYTTTRQSTPFPCGNRCFDNLFWGLPRSGRNGVLADPRFLGGPRRGLGRIGLGVPFRILPGSPAVRAGARLPRDTRPDYFGDPITTPPSIGFDQPHG